MKKRFILSLCILCLFMTVDTLLTITGIEMGLRETNQHAVSYIGKLGIVPGLLWHNAVSCAYIVVLSTVLYNVKAYAAYIGVVCHNVFYIYVLIHNITMIWR